MEEGPLHLRLVTDAGVFLVIPVPALGSFAPLLPGVRLDESLATRWVLGGSAAPCDRSHFLGDGCPPDGGTSWVVGVTVVDVVGGGVVVVEVDVDDGVEVEAAPRFVVDVEF